MDMREEANSILIARKYLDSLVVEGRILGACHPTCKVNILGEEFDTLSMAPV